MKYSVSSPISIGIGLLLLQACSYAPVAYDHSADASAPSEASMAEKENAVLAGEWEYEEDGMVVPLRLDRFGNGTYDFKGGRFRTDLLSDHRWAGAWAQRENDREGGFEITLSPDYKEGEGRWWYTRIERDGAPKKSGGRFHVMKVQSTVGNRDLSMD
jgi:hypothetical protein